MDKIIGAYTPLAFDGAPPNGHSYIEDVSGESFIFSLTEKQKFTLKNKPFAICRQKNTIIFGTNSLFIGEKSNQAN
jgi:hypothetical protein